MQHRALDRPKNSKKNAMEHQALDRLRIPRKMPNGCLNATPREVLKRNEYPGGRTIPRDTQKKEMSI
jgi:hypothetical protein